MDTSPVRFLTEEEMARLPMARAAMEQTGHGNASTRFQFFAAFDGTRNDKDNLKLSGDPFPTNVGNLDRQAEKATSDTFQSRYYPGVGTGGNQGDLGNAAFWPTPAIDAAAEKAYADFSDAALKYLRTHPDATVADLGASVTGFSRGCATAVRFAQLVNDRAPVVQGQHENRSQFRPLNYRDEPRVVTVQQTPEPTAPQTERSAPVQTEPALTR